MRPNGQLIFQHSCICTVFSLILKICASSLCALAHSFYSSQFILASVIKWLMQLHLIDKHIFFQPIFNQIDCVVVLYFYFFVFFRVAIQRFNCLSCKHTAWYWFWCWCWWKINFAASHIDGNCETFDTFGLLMYDIACATVRLPSFFFHSCIPLGMTWKLNSTSQNSMAFGAVVSGVKN